VFSSPISIPGILGYSTKFGVGLLEGALKTVTLIKGVPYKPQGKARNYTGNCAPGWTRKNFEEKCAFWGNLPGKDLDECDHIVLWEIWEFLVGPHSFKLREFRGLRKFSIKWGLHFEKLFSYSGIWGPLVTYFPENWGLTSFYLKVKNP